MSENLKFRDRVSARFALLMAAGAFALSGCTDVWEKNDEQLSNADAVVEKFAQALQNGEDVAILPGAVSTNDAVMLRRSPAEINTNNAAWINGNEVANQEVTLLRPFVVEGTLGNNGETETSQWAGGLSRENGDLYWLALNSETADELIFYKKGGSEADQAPAEFCGSDIENLHVTEVEHHNKSNSLVIDAGGFPKTVGIIEAAETMQPVLDREGYQEYDPCP